MKPLEFKITEDPGVGGRLRLWMGPLCMTPVMRSDSREELEEMAAYMHSIGFFDPEKAPIPNPLEDVKR